VALWRFLIYGHSGAFRRERNSENQEKPVPVGKDDVMKKFSQLLVLSSHLVLPDGIQ
jgi:hypothetical protein